MMSKFSDYGYCVVMMMLTNNAMMVMMVMMLIMLMLIILMTMMLMLVMMMMLTNVNAAEVNAFPNGHLVFINHPPNIYFMNHIYFLFQWDMILTIVMFFVL